jgi:hypothetical protein
MNMYLGKVVMLLQFFGKYYVQMAWACGCSFAGIVASNLAGSMVVCLL